MTLEIHTPAERVEHLIVLTERLSEIMDRESELLETRRPHETAPLVEEKSRLASIYGYEIRAVAKNRALLAGAPPPLTERLKVITKTFEEKAAKQKSLVEGRRRVTEGMIKAVADEIAKQDAPPPSYGPQTNEPRNAAPRPTNLTLNEVI